MAKPTFELVGRNGSAWW